MKFICSTKTSVILTTVALLMQQVLWSQSNPQTPYSRFGIGTIQPLGSATHMANGGLTASSLDPYVINFSNPASYSYLLRTTYQVGLKGSRLILSTDSASQQLNSARLQEFGLGFKKMGSPWAFAMGLVPYSVMSYSLTDQYYVENVGDVEFQYDGSGGLYRALAGVARNFKLQNVPDSLNGKTSRISVGANLNYYFGSVEQTRRAIYLDDVNYLNTRATKNIFVYDIGADFGIHYIAPLKETRKEGKVISSNSLLLGATYSLGKEMRMRHSELYESFYYLFEAERVQDTASFEENVKGSFSLPAKINLGASYFSTNKNQGMFSVGFNYSAQDWSSFQSDVVLTDSETSLGKSNTISAGIEFLPASVDKGNSYFDKITYRMGVNKTNTYLTIKGKQIERQSLSAGLSLPLIASRSSSRINLAVEWGTGGTTENNLVKENFFNVFIGFSLTPIAINNWFVSRKYD